MKKFCPPAFVKGDIGAPGSKSSMQRAILCAALASDGGESLLRRPSDCADARAAAALVEGLGARVEWRHSVLSLGGGILGSTDSADGGAAHGSAAAPAEPPALRLCCGESGFLMRTVAPVACLLGRPVVLEAEGSLAARPVAMLEAPLRSLGAACSTNGGLPPVRLCGPLPGGEIEVDASTSSQFLTGLLIALPLAGHDSILHVARLVSRGYIDLTIDTMRSFGVELSRSPDFSRFDIPGRQKYHSADFTVEGDWSGAAFLLVAGAVACAPGSSLAVEGLDLKSAQPDRAILDALALSGAGAAAKNGHLELAAPAAGTGRGTSLRAFDFDATDCPDLFPPLACLAAAAEGRSRIKGALRLKGKESDRAAALADEFGRMGIPVRVDGDLMCIEGGGGRIRGGRVDARNDHRIAMAAAVAALVSEQGVEIEGAECVGKSWPSFFEDLGSISSPRY